MKTVFALLLLSFTSTAFAAKYNCLDSNGQHLAELEIFTDDEIQWTQPWNSAESAGKFLGVEDAPFSEFKGFRAYRLVDFFATESSMHIFVIESLDGQVVKAATYLDDDDHEVDVERFTCDRSN